MHSTQGTRGKGRKKEETGRKCVPSSFPWTATDSRALALLGRDLQRHISVVLQQFQHHISVILLDYFSTRWQLPPDHDAALSQRVMLVQAEDGRLGIVEADDDGWNRLYRWSWVVSEEGDAQWVERPVMYLDESLPYVACATSSTTTVSLMGFVEGANTILVSTDAGFFTVELHSKRATKVCKNRCIWYPLVPIVSSYTLGSTLEEQHDLRSSDESDGEEWEDKEVDDQEWEEAKALRQTELLFNKGSMALEKGDSVGAVDSFGHVLKLSGSMWWVARYGEFAPECASTYYGYGRALLYKAQKATKLLGNVPKKGTISNADTKEWHNSNGTDQEDRNSGNDKEMAGDGGDSDVDLARKMLDVARVIIEGSTDNTVDSPETSKILRVTIEGHTDHTVDSPEISKILSALTEVSMEKRKRGIRQLGRRLFQSFCILEHLPNCILVVVLICRLSVIEQ